METQKNKKEELTEETETLFQDAVCANECTGLLQGMPIDEADKENYAEVFDYGPEAGSRDVRAGEVSEPHVKRGMDVGDPRGKSRG